MMHYRLFTTFLCVVVGLAADVMAADPLAWLPAEINAVARINVAEIYQSPLAKKEGWIKKATESFIQQEAFIPPGTRQILIGAELDLSDNLMAHRKYAVLVPEAQLTLEKLSAWLPGGIETLSGKPAAQFGNDGYVVDVGDGCWLTTVSSSRQLMSRWLRNGPMPGGPQLSSYLRSALKAKENTAQLILAIDLQDNFSAQEIALQLKSTDWFGSESGAENAAKVLESIHGITIGISVGTERTGTATLDFGRDAAPLKPVLEKMIAAVMKRVGTSSEDVQEWKWSVKGSQVVGTGSVSPGGARGLLSIMDPPSITHAISASSAVIETTPEDRMAKTSHKYCKSVQVLLDDLRATLNKERDNHALYFERYGRKIDDLPSLNVDVALLDYGAKVSSSLRYQGQSQRMHKINAGTRTQQSYGSNGYNGYYGNVGSYNSGNDIYSVAAGSATIGAEENQAAKSVRFAEWKQIEDGLVAVRRAMTAKYNIEF